MKNRPQDRAQRTSLHQVVMDDLKQTRWNQSLPELHKLYSFYLDGERRDELASMGRIRRAFSVLFWILKSLLLKLAPARRVMLLVSLVLAVVGWKKLQILGVTMDFDLRPWGFALLLIVLMLELRDKLLAKDEIAVAREVQLALLPDSHPVIPGWSVWSVSRPANDVGGDLVDYLELDGFRHAVVLGDVAGKGLGAALLTAKLQATLRALVPDTTSLDELGARVDHILHRDGLANRYATLFFAALEHHAGRMLYLNAGHNPAFAVHADRIEKLGASSFPLGMMGTAEYEEGSIEMAPGDALVLYSDGLTEAENAAGEEFGGDRLEAMLRDLRGLTPLEIGRAILDRVDEFLGEARLTDDLSLAVIVRDAD